MLRHPFWQYLFLSALGSLSTEERQDILQAAMKEHHSNIGDIFLIYRCTKSTFYHTLLCTWVSLVKMTKLWAFWNFLCTFLNFPDLLIIVTVVYWYLVRESQSQHKINVNENCVLMIHKPTPWFHRLTPIFNQCIIMSFACYNLKGTFK